MDYGAFRQHLIQEKKLSGSTPEKTIRNVRKLAQANALTPQAFKSYSFKYLQEGKVCYYNKLVQAIKHYWSFMGITADAPPQQTVIAKKKDAFTADEIVAIIAHLKTPYKQYVQLLSITGARPSEIRLLEASQIDYVSQAITINATKTKEERLVPILKMYLDEIHTYARHTQGKLFTFSDTAANKALRQACLKAGVPYKSPKTFRNSFIFRLIQEKVPLFDVMALVGHHNPRTTLSYYRSNLYTLTQAIESDTLGIQAMSQDQKFDLLQKHLDEVAKKLHLSDNTDFDFTYVKKNDKIVFTIKKKPSHKAS